MFGKPKKQCVLVHLQSNYVKTLIRTRVQKQLSAKLSFCGFNREFFSRRRAKRTQEKAQVRQLLPDI